MTPSKRIPPNPHPLRINALQRARKRHRIGQIARLFIRHNLPSRVAWTDVAGAEAAVVVDDDGEGEGGGEEVGDFGEFHFFDAGPAVDHYEAGELCLSIVGGWGVEPAAEGDLVGGFECDVFAWHCDRVGVSLMWYGGAKARREDVV